MNNSLEDMRQLPARRGALARVVAFTGIALGLCRPVEAGSYDDFLLALRRDDVQTLRRLHRRGFDLDTVDETGLPPLLLALREDSLQAAAFLIQQFGFNLDAVNSKGENALMLAALRGHVGLMRLMIRHGAEVNKPGWAPLHYAAIHAERVSAEMVELLLEESAYIDAESPNGTTPLMMAARYGRPDTVGLLLQAGADPHLRNEQGLTALDFAWQADRKDAAALIRRALRPSHLPSRW
jgi:uncharacterized protein